MKKRFWDNRKSCWEIHKCDIYQKYGKSKPIEIKIFGDGCVHAKLQQLLAKRESYR